MGNSVGTEPFADGNALADAHYGDLLNRVGRQLLVFEVGHDLPVVGTARAARFRVPPKLSRQVDAHKRLGKQHLSAPDHAAPALVRIGPGPVDLAEAFAVREPDPGRNVSGKIGFVFGASINGKMGEKVNRFFELEGAFFKEETEGCYNHF